MAEVKELLEEVRSGENDWLKNRNPPWKTNPFDIKDIRNDRKLFAGYNEQMKQFLICVDKGQSALLTGNVGIGKTTFLKYVLNGLPTDEFKYVFIPKAPSSIKTFFADIFEFLTKKRPENSDVTTIYKMVVDEIAKFVGSGMKFIVVIDELGEAHTDVLYWIRSFHDTCGLSIIASGPPETRKLLENKHFPLADRISNQIYLDGFDKEDVYEFINKRIRFACIESDFNNGKQGLCSNKKKTNCNGCLNPFTADAIDELYSFSGGAPRKLLEITNKTVNNAMINGIDIIDLDNVISTLVSESKSLYDNLTEMQKKIINMLKNGSAASKVIAESLDYPIGSILNQLKELMDKGAILRSGSKRNYEFKLPPDLERYLRKAV